MIDMWAHVLTARGVTLAGTRAEILRLAGEPPSLMPPLPASMHEEQSMGKPLSYTVEIEYEGGKTVRQRFARKGDAVTFLIAY